MNKNRVLQTLRRRDAGLLEEEACRLLQRHAREAPADTNIVELGVYKGMGTGFLLMGADEGNKARVVSVDPWGRRKDDYSAHSPSYTAAYPLFRAYIDNLGVPAGRHMVKRGFAVNIGNKWAGGPVSVLHHDSEHSADAVAADLEAWVPHIIPGGVVILHDANDRRFGVEEGAARVLDNEEWDWENRERTVWRRNRHQRGHLVVRRR